MSPYVIPGIPRKSIITGEKIIEVVCWHLGLDTEVIKIRSRKKELVTARQYAMYFMKLKTLYSFKSIGQYFGFDHTTAIHAVNCVNNFLSIKDEITVGNIETIKKLLNEPY